MIAIRPLASLDPSSFQAIASGYRTQEVFRVCHFEERERISFNLTLETLPESGVFQFSYDAGELARYATLVPDTYCLGAYDDALLVGVALAEAQAWNRTLQVWEFHVAEAYRGQGIGRRLMERLAGLAAPAGLRALICETQNTNLPAIRFYRAVGFRLEGVDISYYSNEDMMPGRTVAVFMKRRL